MWHVQVHGSGINAIDCGGGDRDIPVPPKMTLPHDEVDQPGTTGVERQCRHSTNRAVTRFHRSIAMDRDFAGGQLHVLHQRRGVLHGAA